MLEFCSAQQILCIYVEDERDKNQLILSSILPLNPMISQQTQPDYVDV